MEAGTIASQLPGGPRPLKDFTSASYLSGAQVTLNVSGRSGQRLGRGRIGGFAATLSATEWATRLPGDGRKIGVVVHHVASVYPLEIQLALKVADRTASPA